MQILEYIALADYIQDMQTILHVYKTHAETIIISI